MLAKDETAPVWSYQWYQSGTMLKNSTRQKKRSEACGVRPHREWRLCADTMQNITEKEELC